MEIHKVHSVFFSATFTTKAIVQGIVKQLPGLRLGRDELLVVGVPSYSGRVPDTCHYVGEPHKDR